MSKDKECTHDCGSCSHSDCESRSLILEQNAKSSIKNVYAVVSGKGGVGKSLVTSLLAVSSNKAGFKTAVMDADITGPSIPKMFGINKATESADGEIHAAKTKKGISLMSLNLLMENEDDPVVWRGPVISGAVRQFWTDIVWGKVDNMFIDMPPGTGDVPLTVFQSIPIKGIVVVTSPQQLAGMIVRKAVNMAKLMNIPILGIVENMSYLKCPDCGKKIEIFGKSHLAETADKYKIKNYVQLPLDANIPELCDSGKIEEFDTSVFEGFSKKIFK